MMKIRVHVFVPIGHLVTRAPFNSDKVNTVTRIDPLTDLKYLVYVFQYDSTHDKFNSTIKVESGKLGINEKPIFIFQELDSTNITMA